MEFSILCSVRFAFPAPYVKMFFSPKFKDLFVWFCIVIFQNYFALRFFRSKPEKHWPQTQF